MFWMPRGLPPLKNETWFASNFVRRMKCGSPQQSDFLQLPIIWIRYFYLSWSLIGEGFRSHSKYFSFCFYVRNENFCFCFLADITFFNSSFFPLCNSTASSSILSGRSCLTSYIYTCRLERIGYTGISKWDTIIRAYTRYFLHFNLQ